jgi:hypothetical protein
MQLPLLIQQLYGQTVFSGLYSAEFVDENRNTIAEIFFMCPPKNKSVSEPTRSSTIATMGGNYIIDGGNATKQISISGDLYFPYVGSPDNPVATNSGELENTITGLEEFFKLQWMLIRYRDYTMTSNAKMNVPSSLMSVKGISQLYKSVSKQVKNKTGALYDKVRLIIHDYDMNDHFYCRVENFSSSQSADKYIVINYSIVFDCYEPDSKQRKTTITNQVKPTTNESINSVNTNFQNIGFSTIFDNVQASFGYNTLFINASQYISDLITKINTENQNIQAGKSIASKNMPVYISDLITYLETCMSNFISTFLTVAQQAEYTACTLTLEDVVSRNLLVYYNSLQKLKLQAESLNGVLTSMIEISTLRYSTDADDYTLTTDQFDSTDTNLVESSTSFFYYRVIDGDNARIIAQRELNDQEQFIRILKINDITENDFIDGTIVGQLIKIPYAISVTARSEDNLVYESDYTNTDAFLYGSDLAVNVNDNLESDSAGDLLNQVGIENVYENIENRITNNKGSMNIFQTSWGTDPVDSSNAPLLVKIDRYIEDVVEQIQSDPRVESAKVNLKKVEWNGETLSIPTTVTFIGNDQTYEVTATNG